MSLLLLAPGTSAAEPLDARLSREVAGLQQTAQKGRLAYEIVSSLTTEVGARLAGTPAEARARAWAVEKLKALGFTRVWVEKTTVEGWARGEERARIVTPFPQALSVTALGLSVATPPEGITGEVVRFAGLPALEAAPDAAVKGKIAFIDQAMPKTQDGSGYGATVGIRSAGPTAAAQKGARAVLIRSVGTDHHRFPHTGMLRYREGTAPIPAGALSIPDADQLTRVLATSKRTVVELVLTPRFTGPQETGNVVAEIRGRTRPQEIVLLGAHLDSWDLGTGAVDDGAGVAITMAALKLMRDVGRKPDRTIRLVLFGAEEVGLIGAKAYAEKHADELAQHVLAAESDFGAEPVYRLSGEVDDSAWPQIAALHPHVAALKVILGRNGRAGGPDLYPLKKKGVPILGLDQDGRDYFDVHHTADDVIDRIDPDRINQNVAVYATTLWIVANQPGQFRGQDRQL